MRRGAGLEPSPVVQRGINTTATAAVAAEMIAGRPPNSEITIPIDASSPTLGSTPAHAAGTAVQECNRSMRVARPQRHGPRAFNRGSRELPKDGV